MQLACVVQNRCLCVDVVVSVVTVIILDGIVIIAVLTSRPYAARTDDCSRDLLHPLVPLFHRPARPIRRRGACCHDFALSTHKGTSNLLCPVDSLNNV